MRLVWITDVHLNFCTASVRASFYESIVARSPEAVLLGGDVAEADSWLQYLHEFADRVRVPIYFVLGNHDFYGGSIEEVRRKASNLTVESRHLRWLPACPPVPIGDDTVLIGHDGWADGQLGSYAASDILLNDYVLIHELAGLDKWARLKKLRELGQQAAAFLDRQCGAALAHWKRVLVLTHVPPFGEACWYQGRLSDANWMPHFTCRAAGETLRAAMLAHPERTMTVLCGHTHGGGYARILDNLEVYTGQSEYFAPAIQNITLPFCT